MTKEEIVSTVKRNKLIYTVYYYLMSAFINVVKCFVKPDDKLVLFVSYGGRYYNDSPRCLYEAMLKDRRFEGYRLVWAFIQPEKYPELNTVKIDSLGYYMIALKARCWITNVSVERGLRFKGKRTYYFHTTHTTLPKLMGYDDKSGTFSLPFGCQYDCSCAQSVKEKELQKSMFGLSDEQILVSGYPKLDMLCSYSEEQRNTVRDRLGIAKNKKAILYAPTYRDVHFGDTSYPIDFAKWKSILGDDYIILFRAHPVVAKSLKIDSDNNFVKDVSSYPDNMELMMASDLLVSDYSGIFFEYAVQINKMMYCYAYDYDEYIKTRGLYFDIRDLIPGGHLKEDELLYLIKDGNNETALESLNKFRSQYVSQYGNAISICLDNIMSKIS